MKNYICCKTWSEDKLEEFRQDYETMPSLEEMAEKWGYKKSTIKVYAITLGYRRGYKLRYHQFNDADDDLIRREWPYADRTRKEALAKTIGVGVARCYDRAYILGVNKRAKYRK